MRILLGLRKIIGLGFFACIVIFILSLFGGGKSGSDGLPTLAVLPSITWTSEVAALPSSTWTPEPVAATSTEPPGVTIIPTVVQASSGFITMTPAPGSTAFPTPTITDTPQPTVTNTNLPTATDVPISTPTIAVRSVGALTYYLKRTANVRSCASSTCNKLGVVETGTSVTVSGIVQGETVTGGNSTWYQVQYGGASAFIYSAYLTDVAPVQVQQPVIVQQQPAQPAVVQQPPPQQEVQQPVTSDSSSGATALCNDGTYSYSANHRGTCSHHGGVAVWYK